MAKKRASLLDGIETVVPTRVGKLSWFDRLTEDQRADLVELRRRYREDLLPGVWSQAFMHKYACDPSRLGDVCSLSAFQNWLHGRLGGK